MTWHFDHLLKGQVTQTILQSVLERFGYAVRRLGVEEVLPELRTPLGDKLRPNLPQALRFLPDFLVMDPQNGDIHLTEVKYRCSISKASLRALAAEIDMRRPFWPDTCTVLMISDAKTDRGYHQDYMRVITPDDIEQLADDNVASWTRWQNLPHIQSVFKRLFQDFNNQQIADAVTIPLRDLAKIERPRRLEDMPVRNSFDDF